jgi:hypothetical protein
MHPHPRLTETERTAAAERIARHYRQMHRRSELPAAQILAACVIGCMGLAVVGTLAILFVHAARAIDRVIAAGVW